MGGRSSTQLAGIVASGWEGIRSGGLYSKLFSVRQRVQRQDPAALIMPRVIKRLAETGDNMVHISELGAVMRAMNNVSWEVLKAAISI